MHQYRTYIRVGSLLGLTLLSGAIITAPKASADSSGAIDITAILPTNCSLIATNNSLVKEATPGTPNTIGTAKFKATCNDAAGFAIYAVGYTNSEYGNTDLVTDLGEDYNIKTGTGNSGDTSNWNMTIGNDTEIQSNVVADIAESFDTAHTIPTVYTKVASFTASTDQSIGSNLTAKFDTYIAPGQPASTYTGKVKFTLVHPANAEAPDHSHGVTMQTVAEWGGDIVQGQIVTAIDERDGEEYTVTRLADGKLWMTKNLRLDFSKLTKSDQELENLTNGPASGFFAAAKIADMSNSWCTNSDSSCTDQIQYNTSNINGDSCPSGDCDEYGVYYNWYTATAGNGYYDMPGYSIAQGDICPSGWHLPSSDNAQSVYAGDFYDLGVAISGETATSYFDIQYARLMLAAPNNFVLSGSVHGTNGNMEIGGRGERGAYWSSVKHENKWHAYYWYISNSSIQLNNYGDGYIYYGNSIRCIAD